MTTENDGRFPDGAAVEVRFPVTIEQKTSRESWPWLPGHILEQCGPDEWQVVVDGVPDLGEAEQGGEVFYPAPFRDSSEIRTPLSAERSTARADDDADGM